MTARRPATYRLFTLLAAAVLAAGCATRAATPDPDPEPAAVPANPGKAATPRPGPTVITGHRPVAPALTPEQIRLLVWNVRKGRADDWTDDFRTLAADSHLVLLQEAQLHPGFTDSLAGAGRWDMAEAWRWRSATSGVLTASVVEPLSVRATRHPEPVLRLGKTALVTEYRIEGSSQTLLVANIHAINFSTSLRTFRAQLIAVADLLDEHTGPVILSGDLNTWRAERKRTVALIAEALGLREVHFDGPRKQFRQFPLDHVYYRGLELVDSAVTAVASSDHNPLHVTFRMPGAATPTAED